MAFDLEKFPTSPSAKRMIASVSEEFYEKSYVGKWLYQVMGLELDDVRAVTETLPEQAFPETATWGLMYHEIKWGLPVRENLSYDERRRLIYRKRDMRAPMSPWRLEWYLENYTGYNFRIEDVNDAHIYGWEPLHPNTFKVYITDVEGTVDAKTVKSRLDALRQSHTTYSMQERVDFIIDQSDLEYLDAFRLMLHWAINFWGNPYHLDGTYYLDGTLPLEAGLRYNLIPRIRYAIKLPKSPEAFVPHKIHFSSWIQLCEAIEHLRTKYGWEAPFWRKARLDGSYLLDGSLRLNGVTGYDLIPGIIYRLKIPTAHEKFAYPKATFNGSVKTTEKIDAKANFGPIVADFWNRINLNGASMLDGTILLDGGFRYDLNTSIQIKGTSQPIEEQILSPKTRLCFSIPETMEMHAGIAFFGWSILWNRLLLDGSGLLNGSRILDGARRGGKATVAVRGILPKVEEKNDHVSLTTSTRDYAFLDSSLALNGSRLLNSIYRKEDL